MEIGLNVKDKDGSQAVGYKSIKIFMDEKDESSTIHLWGVAYTSVKVNYAPSNFY